ncbi:MAG: response regulator transcription factor [Polyangiaceae bacterium]|nr:response regulator transcription factor [Polyangiaceae bacterium]
MLRTRDLTKRASGEDKRSESAVTAEARPALRLALVEDDPSYRETLVDVLSNAPPLELVEGFGEGRPLLEALEALSPDVVLVDLELPDIGGPELITAIKARRPAIEVMAHTVSEARDVVFAAVRAGATGYILKGASPEELVEAIFDLAAGGAPMSPRIARSVIRVFQNENIVAEDYLLTARERDVLALLERGYTYKDAAQELNLSPHTVHSHIKKVYEKLHATSRNEAVRRARLKGLI